MSEKRFGFSALELSRLQVTKLPKEIGFPDSWVMAMDLCVGIIEDQEAFLKMVNYKGIIINMCSQNIEYNSVVERIIRNTDVICLKDNCLELSFLSNLTNLKYLWIQNCRGYIDFKYLDLHVLSIPNTIEFINIEFLKKLTALQLLGNVSDIGKDAIFLREFSNLKYVNFVRPSLCRLDGLASLGIENLKISYATKLTDISAVSDMAGTLCALSIINSKQIHDLHGVFNAKNLEMMDIWRCDHINSIEKLENMKKIKIARIIDTKIIDMKYHDIKIKMGDRLIVDPVYRRYI